MWRQSRCYLDLDFDRVCLWILEEVFEHLSVHDEGVEVIADSLDIDVSVDEVDCFRAKGVPEQLAVAGGRLERVVDLRKPPVVILIRLEQRVRGQRFPELGERWKSSAKRSRCSVCGSRS